MDKVHTSERLKKIMSERNLKQIDIINLAKPLCDIYKIKLGRNDISQYVSGKVEPRQNKLYILAKVLNVNEAWLMGYDVPMERISDSYIDVFQYDNIKPISKKKIPMLGKIACGQPLYCDEDYETYIEASSDIKADFCLTAKGDSMINARIFDGDIVFIRNQPTVENGEIAAVIINDEATLKRVYKYGNRLELRPENPTFSVINIEGEELNNVRILGKAVAFMSYVR